MTKLKGLKGTNIQFKDSDPVEYVGTWSSGGNLNQRRGSTKGFGTTTAAITAGGVYSPISPPSAQAGQVENYNGTSWTEVAELNVARQAHQSAGTATAGMVALGYKNGGNAPETELWNGSAWTETADANTARTSVRGCGTTTAALAIGGYNPPPALQLDITESWNGSAWSEVNDMNTRRSGAGVAVSSPYSDTIIFGGYSQPPPNTANAETWNGSSWSETGNLNTAKDNMGGAGASSTSALCFGGRGPIVNTESWDGTSWTEVNNMAKGRGYMASAGVAGAALASGGESPGSPPTNYYDNETEAFTFPAITASTLNEGDMWFNSSVGSLKGYGSAATPTGTFASGGNLNVAKGQAAGAGTQSAGIFMGGRLGPPPNAAVNETELYNGSTWTEVNNLTTARYSLGGANAGSQTATLAFGGYSTTDVANTESWDGTNWTEVNDLNTAGSNGAGFGTQTAAIYTGGDSRSNNKTESWDGTNWTETTDLNTARAQMCGFGISTAGLIAGGDLYPVTSPTRLSVQTELWNGSAWTEVNDLNTGRRRIGSGGFGTQTSGLTAGGYTTTYVANTESWNGTSWAEQTEISTRDNTTGIGTGAPSGLIAGGGTSPGAMSTATEEWIVGNAVVTVTTS